MCHKANNICVKNELFTIKLFNIVFALPILKRIIKQIVYSFIHLLLQYVCVFH